MKKTFFIVAGSFSLVLGVVGVFLPILPTTPFLLLSAALFARSSEKLYMWLIYHKIFGKYIRNFREDKAIPLRAKIFSIITLWLFMLYSIFFIVNEKWYLQALLGSIAMGVTIYILSFKTKNVEKAK
ncbi:MAG: YbaN family protein [Paludibacteraceae bacterium]